MHVRSLEDWQRLISSMAIRLDASDIALSGSVQSMSDCGSKPKAAYARAAVVSRSTHST
jgi:hypothetical protein